MCQTLKELSLGPLPPRAGMGKKLRGTKSRLQVGLGVGVVSGALPSSHCQVKATFGCSGVERKPPAHLLGCAFRLDGLVSPCSALSPASLSG